MAAKAKPLDGVFHYAAARGTFKGEILAGLCMGFLAVCGCFMNMQLVLQYVTSDYFSSAANVISVNGEMIAITWFSSMLIAAIGTIVMGVVARRPFVQVSSMSLSCVLVSTLSVTSGLSYYNMLAIVFVGNVAYLAIAALPPLRRIFVDGLPRSVRTALPAAAGLLMAYVAAQLSGVFMIASRGAVAYGTQQMMGAGQALLSGTPRLSAYNYLSDAYHPQLLLSALACVVALAVYLFLARKVKTTPFFTSLLVGTVFFLVSTALLVGVIWRTHGFSFSYLWARLWMVGAEDAMQAHLSTVFGNLQVGKVFRSGFAFGALEESGGRVGLAIASGALSYVFLFLYDAQSTIDACDDLVKAEEPSDPMLPMLINAATNVAATVLTVAPVAIGKESVAGTRDRGRSGLASVVAGLVMLVSAFVWVVPAIFATITSYTVQFNMYGHYGKVLQLLTMCSFSVVDVVMILCGLLMAGRAIEKGLSGTVERAPFIATIAGTFLLSNLALGVACGVVAHVVVNASKPARKKGVAPTSLIERVGGMQTLVLAAVLLAVLVASIA